MKSNVAICCELCGKKAKVDFKMPTDLGRFRTHICYKCEFLYGEKILLKKVIEKRAKSRGKKLPVNHNLLMELMEIGQ